MAPNPHDLAQRSLAPGDAAGEIARARAALEPAITVQTLDPGEHATLAALERHLHAGPAILYLVCHGQLVDGRPYLVLEDEWGAAQRIRGEDLAARLEQLRSRPQLVVLAACESAGPAALAPAADHASMATVAHCMPVFFAELAQHGVIDLAAARRCVAGRPDWWAPVLYLRLLSGRLFAARDPVAAAPFRVPFLRNPSFVGREQDLADLHAALASAATVGIRSALSTAAASAAGLTGMGGIGKTQLAVEYCYRYRDAYPGGILWLNAAAGYLNTHADGLLMLDNVTDPGQLRELVTPDLIPANLRLARLGLLAGVPAKEDIVFGSPLDRALDELGRLSLIEGLAGDELRLHPLVREFAQTQTRNADTPAFRHTCALNLLGAYAAA